MTAPAASDARIVEAMIDLAHCSTRHRIVVTGPHGPHQMFELLRRGYNRVATTSTCGLPCGQYDAAFVGSPLPSVKVLETTLDWLVHFLSPTGVLVLWIDQPLCPEQRKVRSILEKLGLHVEAGTRCGDGLALSARRREANQRSVAA